MVFSTPQLLKAHAGTSLWDEPSHFSPVGPQALDTSNNKLSPVVCNQDHSSGILWIDTAKSWAKPTALATENPSASVPCIIADPESPIANDCDFDCDNFALRLSSPAAKGHSDWEDGELARPLSSRTMCGERPHSDVELWEPRSPPQSICQLGESSPMCRDHTPRAEEGLLLASSPTCSNELPTEFVNSLRHKRKLWSASPSNPKRSRARTSQKTSKLQRSQSFDQRHMSRPSSILELRNNWCSPIQPVYQTTRAQEEAPSEESISASAIVKFNSRLAHLKKTPSDDTS